MDSDSNLRYEYLILQDGTLPLAPNGSRNRRVDHRCTATLIWPEGERPHAGNTLLIDPCFTRRGVQQAQSRLGEIGLSLADAGTVFVTHQHGDHLPRLPLGLEFPPVARFGIDTPPFEGLNLISLRGHASDLKAITFRTSDNRCIWVVGDAILNQSWLEAWMYYWPNSYKPPEITRTWCSVAQIIAGADVIIPGHGAPITVTPALIKRLLAALPNAPHIDLAPRVAGQLKTRLAHLSAYVENSPNPPTE